MGASLIGAIHVNTWRRDMNRGIRWWGWSYVSSPVAKVVAYALDRRLMLGGAAALAFVAARPGRAQWSGVPEAIMRLNERLRGLDADGLDSAWYGLPAREMAMSDPAGFQSATQNAARQALP